MDIPPSHLSRFIARVVPDDEKFIARICAVEGVRWSVAARFCDRLDKMSRYTDLDYRKIWLARKMRGRR